MIWAVYHHGISHKSAIRRGRWVARVRYHAWRTAIPRVAWTNGTMAVPRRGLSRALWYRPRVRAQGRQLLVLRPRSVGNRGGRGASFLLGLYLAGALRRGPGHPQFLHEDRRSHNRGSVRPYFLE